MNYMNVRNETINDHDSGNGNGSGLSTRSVNRNAMIFANIDGEVTYMNAEAQRLTGWSVRDAAKVDSQVVFKIFDIKTENSLDNPVASVVENESKIELTENTVLASKGGGFFEIEFKASPKYSDSGELNRVIITFREIREINERPNEKEQETNGDIPGQKEKANELSENVSFSEAANGDNGELSLDIAEEDSKNSGADDQGNAKSEEAGPGFYDLSLEEVEKPDFVS